MNDLRGALGEPSPGVAEAARRALDRVASIAERAGLLDVAIAHQPSPVGRLFLAATPLGLVRIAYPEEGVEPVLDDLARHVSPRILEAPERLDPILRQLDEYFTGARTRFELPIDWSLTRGFSKEVLRTTARIPFGEVRTYGEVAAEAGSPRAARAAGNALASNPIPVVVPCHRVVRVGGDLGGYAGGVERKAFLLRLEEVA